MAGDVYHKVVRIPSKWTIAGVVVIGIVFIYTILAFAGVIPAGYNVFSSITGEHKTVSGNNTTQVSSLPKIEVWGIPNEVNITNNPHTAWQITFKVVRGNINNFEFAFIPHGLKNVSVSLSSASSNWQINGFEAKYNGYLSQGAFVSITLNIDAQENYTIYDGAFIEFMPETVGITFESQVFEIAVVQ